MEWSHSMKNGSFAAAWLLYLAWSLLHQHITWTVITLIYACKFYKITIITRKANFVLCLIWHWNLMTYPLSCFSVWGTKSLRHPTGALSRTPLGDRSPSNPLLWPPVKNFRIRPWTQVINSLFRYVSFNYNHTWNESSMSLSTRNLNNLHWTWPRY